MRNTGAAFSLLAHSGAASWRLYFLIGVAAVTVVLLTWLAFREAPERLVPLLPMGLVCGGALGNLWDRVTTGTVVDFIEMGIGPYRFPVYNLADPAVLAGVLWILWLSFRRSDRAGQPS